MIHADKQAKYFGYLNELKFLYSEEVEGRFMEEVKGSIPSNAQILRLEEVEGGKLRAYYDDGGWLESDLDELDHSRALERAFELWTQKDGRPERNKTSASFIRSESNTWNKCRDLLLDIDQKNLHPLFREASQMLEIVSKLLNSIKSFEASSENDFIESTVEDYLSEFKPLMSNSDYGMLVSAFVHYNKEGNFPSNFRGVVKIKRPGMKKRLGSALGSIVESEGRRVDIRVLRFVTQHISIYLDEELDKEPFHRNNIYKLLRP